MKKIIIFSIFLIFSVFLMNQHTFAETEDEKERKELVENAANSLKRENTDSKTKVIDDKSEKKDVLQNLTFGALPGVKFD